MSLPPHTSGTPSLVRICRSGFIDIHKTFRENQSLARKFKRDMHVEDGNSSKFSDMADKPLKRRQLLPFSIKTRENIKSFSSPPRELLLCVIHNLYSAFAEPFEEFVRETWRGQCGVFSTVSTNATIITAVFLAAYKENHRSFINR
jgi:hypothetical protein